MTATHAHHPVAAANGAANPLVVEVTRGDMVESRHRAAAAILDRTGKVIEAWGDIHRPVYGRSATKPLQDRFDQLTRQLQNHINQLIQQLQDARALIDALGGTELGRQLARQRQVDAARALKAQAEAEL